MAKTKILHKLYLMLFFSASVSAYAQVGSIKGRILDKDTRETLSGALVTLVGTDIKAYSDLDGNFSFDNIEAGIYKIRVSYISFSTITISSVEIKDSETKNISITLKPMEAQLSKEAEVLYSRQLISSAEGVNSI